MARRDKGKERAIARDRLDRLVTLADAALRADHPERAHRYADLMWRLKTRYQLPPSGVESRICRACHAFLSPGRTARIRFTGGRMSTTCLACGHVRRRVLPARATPAAAAQL